MKRRTFVKNTVVALPAIGAAGALEPMALPKPEIDPALSLAKALKERRTTRAIGPEPLPLPLLANLLWAAFGVNRPEAGVMGLPGRTAPSASNSQEIGLYVALPQGVYLYEAVPHRLAPVAAGDFRRLAGQGRALRAPLVIFYVADLSRYVVGHGQPDPSIGEPEVQKSYYFADTGFIAQNVYLFAAAQGLAAWFSNCDREKAAKEFKLGPRQRVLFAQAVGRPGRMAAIPLGGFPAKG
jgi:nitroreductase